MTSEQVSIKNDGVFLDYTVPNLTCNGMVSDFSFAAIYRGQQLTVVAGALLCDTNGNNLQSISAQTTVSRRALQITWVRSRSAMATIAARRRTTRRSPTRSNN